MKELDQSQILMLPGGFSGGDEPDGSAKFIAAFFRNPAVADAVNRDVYKRQAFDYVVVAQDDPLALGMVDALAKVGIPAFGPDRCV